jgi:hypothetical protein
VIFRRRCSSVAEQLIRNQQVAGSSPAAGSSSSPSYATAASDNRVSRELLAVCLLSRLGPRRVAQKCLKGRGGALQLPATVQAILAARIDRLAPGDKKLLKTASVIGKDVPFPLLEVIADEPEEQLREGLARLQSAEFLYYEAPLFPGLEYSFKHALTHEVAYGGLLQDRRRILHARIVQAVEALYPERLVEHVERLAHHARRAEAWEKALRYARQARDKAASRSAFRDAVGWLEQALGVMAKLPHQTRTFLPRRSTSVSSSETCSSLSGSTAGSWATSRRPSASPACLETNDAWDGSART